jgi:hypothetical protein
VRAEDKRKLLTPDTEPNPRDQGLGCYSWLAGLLLVSLVGAVVTDSKIVVGITIVLGALGFLATYFYFQDRLDVKRFREWAIRNRRFAIVVTSDSPKWASRINDKWLTRFGENVSVLNYSHKREWPRTTESKFVNLFTRYQRDHPIVIIPRKMGRPAVYSFHAALIAAFHGDDDSLKKMEEQMFKEYAEWRERN